ncbi:hypothetical protein CIB95_02655 [Lottiidibacillus patelloidae]|uniref:Uncharacterized protein n=2 Tax=Lottiidibacillus patelloidae TaxID=2670334 RepID=A0A263BYX7_9BACI|nr:hypothetical protein CIB95_02655 [Lottiidibacillus patelloidae]
MVSSFIIFLAMSIGGLFYYVSHDGEFTKWGHTTFGKSITNDGKAYYVDYHFTWDGIGNPTLEKVEFIKNDGIVITENDVQFRIKTFVANNMRGAFPEEQAIKEGIVDELIPVNGYQVKDEFYLVLIVKLVDPEMDNDIKTVRITYSKFGITQFQNIPFDDGIITDE